VNNWPAVLALLIVIVLADPNALMVLSTLRSIWFSRRHGWRM
jgi:hypothetical protein